MKRTVRTTFRPDVELEVDDAEYLDLQRQGLLVTDEAPAKADTSARTGTGNAGQESGK